VVDLAAVAALVGSVPFAAMMDLADRWLTGLLARDFDCSWFAAKEALAGDHLFVPTNTLF
jgi:hypothetical protein